MLNISSVDRGAVVTKFVDFLWRIYGLPLWINEGRLLRFGSGFQYGTEVLSGSLLSILKGRYLLKRRKVTVTGLHV